MQTLISIIELILVVVPALLVVAFTKVAERKTIASMQRRLVPSIVGYYGLLQAFANTIKLLLKECVSPTQANLVLFFLAPLITFIFPLLGHAVISYGPGLTIVNIHIIYLIVNILLGILYIIVQSNLVELKRNIGLLLDAIMIIDDVIYTWRRDAKGNLKLHNSQLISRGKLSDRLLKVAPQININFIFSISILFYMCGSLLLYTVNYMEHNIEFLKDFLLLMDNNSGDGGNDFGGSDPGSSGGGNPNGSGNNEADTSLGTKRKYEEDSEQPDVIRGAPDPPTSPQNLSSSVSSTSNAEPLISNPENSSNAQPSVSSDTSSPIPRSPSNSPLPFSDAGYESTSTNQYNTPVPSDCIGQDCIESIENSSRDPCRDCGMGSVRTNTIAVTGGRGHIYTNKFGAECNCTRCPNCWDGRSHLINDQFVTERHN